MTQQNAKYRYFVSYRSTSSTENAFGSLEIGLPSPIKGYNEIRTITEFLNNHIKDSKGNPCSCVVLYFQIFEDDDLIFN